MKKETILKIIGLVPIIFLALVYLVFGIGESAGGEIGGWMHLVEFAVIALVIFVCWKFPLWGGILLLAIALFRIVAFIPELWMRPPDALWNFSFVLLIVIPLISGGLFFYAGLLDRKAKAAT